MVFQAFLRSFFSIIRSPLLFLPAAIAVLVNALAVILLQEPIIVLLSELVAGTFTTIDASLGPTFFITTFASEWLALLALILISLLSNSWLGVVFGRFVQSQETKKPAVLEATVFGLRRLPRLIAWSLFLLIIGLFFVALVFFISGIGYWNEWIGLLLLIALIIVTIFAAFVLLLAIPLMGLQDYGIKQALKESREIVSRRLAGLLVFFILLGIFIVFIQVIGNFLSDVFEDELIAVLITVVFMLVQSIVVNLSIPFFCIEKKRS